ncbi:MAG: family deacetylase [Chthoniobacteraceae bacterium]|nr:family deacetylase [Chthoniobacteraceae bacterium]
MPSAIAIAAHPDDVEFVMAGTLLLLRAAGWEIHYLNLSTGSLGSMSLTTAETIRIRRKEAKSAAALLGSKWHAPLCNDLEIFYENRTLRRLCSVIRKVKPTVILTHSPQDYMEDHMNTARLAVTAAFARGMPNYMSIPSREPVQTPVTLYHASPHGLEDGLRGRIIPGTFVDTTSVHEHKRAALACHASQKAWLDVTQGMDSYLAAMDDFSSTLGKLSGKFRHAEGWRIHSHLGFCEETADPLRDVLGGYYLANTSDLKT